MKARSSNDETERACLLILYTHQIEAKGKKPRSRSSKWM